MRLNLAVGDSIEMAASIVVAEGTALPAHYMGRFFGADPLHRNVVIAERYRRGSTFETSDSGVAVAAKDPAFRPVFVANAPDGSIYVADFYEEFIAHGQNYQGQIDPSTGRIYRIRGKDYIIAIRDDGNVYLMNRRGELLKNFPLNLNARPSGDYYLETGSSRENTAFVLVSRDGFRIKFNLDGKVLTREALVKNTVDAHFSLVPEKDFKSYMILRQEAKQLTLFDEKLNTVVSSDFIGRPTHTQYNDFGSGKVYITVTDTSQDLSFAFDGQGKLVTILPFESYGIALQPVDLDKVRVYTVFENALTAQPLQTSGD